MLDQIIKFRYLIAIVIFVLSVGLNLHGSSMNNWSNMGVRETSEGVQLQTQNEFQTETGDLKTIETIINWLSIPPREDGTIWGVSRMIRSDEWLVQTPFYISQSNTDFELINKSYAISGQNMLVAYNAPIKHISVIGKPFNWGFLMFGAEKGLSWYWSFKIIGFILLAFEFSMIITKRNKILSLVGSFWITFTPAIQWWFMQHLGDVVFFTLMMIVAIYHYFHSKKLQNKLLFATLLSIAMIGFALVIYPAFQVVFAYLIAGFFVIEFVRALRHKQLYLVDYVIMASTFIFSISVILLSILDSLDALQLTLNTIYPGSRVSVGGEISLSQISEVILNLIIPFKVPKFTNQVELSSAIQFAPFCFVILPFIFSKKDWKKEIFGLLTLCFYIFLCFYAIVGWPEFLSKITLFSFVTGGRAWQAASILGVFISIWFMGYIWRNHKSISKLVYVPVVLLMLLYTYFGLSNQNYVQYIGMIPLLVLFIIFFGTFILLITQHKKLALLVVASMIFLSGMTVNPIVYGLDSLEGKSLTAQIKKMVTEDDSAIWLSENSHFYQYPQMFGAKAVDGVRFYPDKTLMAKIDPKNEFETEWNRYAHVHYTLIDSETIMENPAPDNLHIYLNVKDLAKLKIKNILTNRELDSLFGNQIKLIYGPDLDGNRIYSFEGSSE